ncbi:MAG: carbon-nitrogen hydrolase family protein, partial [Chloroflexota bacterium]
MPRELTIAAVQMNAEPTPKADRLARAATLIARAADDGAQLVVLPELFNAGYEYHENNYALPEAIDGETVTWMKEQAAQHNIHLTGSLLLIDGKHVYNSQIMLAPDGRRWRYNKNYPYAHERAYFRDGSDEMIAHTDLGKIGMLVCWDYAHSEIWARYAGKIDLMV